MADAAALAIGSVAIELTRRRQVAALATVCVSLMVITIDVTILNVALPTLATELNADTSAPMVRQRLRIWSSPACCSRPAHWPTVSVAAAPFQPGCWCSALPRRRAPCPIRPAN